MKNWKRLSSRTVWLIELEKETTILLCCCCPDFKLYYSLLQCTECVQSKKNGVDLVEVSIFKSEKTNGQTVRPIDKYKNSSSFLSYHGRLVFKLVFYLLLCFGHIQSKNEVALFKSKYFSKIGQDGVSTILADQNKKGDHSRLQTFIMAFTTL